MINDQRQRLATYAILQNFGGKEDNDMDKIIDNMLDDEEIPQINESHIFSSDSLNT